MSSTKRKKREAKKKAVMRKRVRSRYYETPKAWAHPCQNCRAEHSAVFRPAGNVYLCESCAAKRGVKSRAANSAKDGGAQTDPTVRVKFVDPSEMKW